MPTFTAAKGAATVQARGGIDVTTQSETIAIPTGFATNDDLAMFRVPAGAQILDVTLSSSAGVGATANLTVGDATVNNRFITSTAFTASTVARLNAHTGHGHRYTDETMIRVYGASIATPTVGTIVRLTVKYSMQQ